MVVHQRSEYGKQATIKYGYIHVHAEQVLMEKYGYIQSNILYTSQHLSA
jgi:hypothetical protein